MRKRVTTKKKCTTDCNICPCAVGVSFGIVFGLGMMVLAYISSCWGMGAPLVDLISTVYLGYNSSLVGGLIGFFWGFVDGFISGFLIAYIYRFIVTKICCCFTCKKSK